MTSSSLPATTPTITSVTSTTTGRTLICGNGQLDPGEDCDPAMPGVSARCCIQCLRQGVGTPCRLAVPGLPCDLSDICDENAACLVRVFGTDFSCREPFTADNCDAGDVCDGVDPRCPTSGLGGACPIKVTVQARSVRVECRAQALDRVGRGESRCEADGIDGRGVAAAFGRAVESVVMKPVSKPIPFKRRVREGRRVLKLRLNKEGKRRLKIDGSLPVRVRVTVRHGEGTIRQQAVDALLKRRR